MRAVFALRGLVALLALLALIALLALLCVRTERAKCKFFLRAARAKCNKNILRVARANANNLLSCFA